MKKTIILFIALFLFFSSITHAQLRLGAGYSVSKLGRMTNISNNRYLIFPFSVELFYQIPDTRWHFGGEFGFFGITNRNQNVVFTNVETGSDAMTAQILMQFDLIKKEKKLIPYLQTGVGRMFYETLMNVNNPNNSDIDLEVRTISSNSNTMINIGAGLRWRLYPFFVTKHILFLDARVTTFHIPTLTYLNLYANTNPDYQGNGTLKEITITNPQNNLSHSFLAGREYSSAFNFWQAKISVLFQF